VYTLSSNFLYGRKARLITAVKVRVKVKCVMPLLRAVSLEK